MELLLIRHGLPERAEADQGRRADPGLASQGWEQAEALAAWLDVAPPEHVYASPMQRALDTATPLAKRVGEEPTVRDGLAEYDRGANYYVPVEELRRSGDPRYQELIDDWTGPERRPDREAFRADVVRTIDTIAGDHPSARIAVVCHGGVINAYLGTVLGIDQRLLFFSPAYTSITRVEWSQQGQRTMLSANETGHLRRA